MKASIVIAIYNSPEIYKRQLLHFSRINLPNDVEVVFVDDGSDVPLINPGNLPFNFNLYFTGNKKRWTQPAARNYGAKKASGEYLILTDIDHIVPIEVIEAARDCPYDVLRLKRQAGILTEDGVFTQDHDELRKYNLIERYFRRGLKLPPHGNSFIIRKSLFFKMGGVDERYVGKEIYPNREEISLKRKLKKEREENNITIVEDDRRPTIYMIPNGKYCGDKDYNPFGLFHNLSRRSNKDKHRERVKRNNTSKKRDVSQAYG